MKIRTIFIITLSLLFAFQALAQETKKVQQKKKILTQQKRVTAEATSRMRLSLRPGEQAVSVPAAAFSIDWPHTSTWSNDGSEIHAHSSGSFIAPLCLPHGAKITRIAMVCYDNDPDFNPNLWLIRKADFVPPADGPRRDIMASVNIAGAYGGYAW